MSKRSITPTAKKKYDEVYASEYDLNWEFINSNAIKCAIDTKTREFQYKILNRILPLNDFLFKIGKIDSPLCTFCQSSEETMCHLFFSVVRWYQVSGIQLSIYWKITTSM